MSNEHHVAAEHKKNEENTEFFAILKHANNLILILEFFDVQ